MNILFDLDGTIIDPGDGIIKSYSKALVALGHQDKITLDMSWVVGPPLRKSFATILPEEMVEEAVAKYREFHAQGGLKEAVLYDGIADIIAQLNDTGHQLFICTAKNVPFARQNIEQFNLEGYFTEIYGSHLDGKFDDKAELVGHIIDTHDLNKSETIMIGDREHDIIAARKNGINGIGVLWGYGKEEELSNAGAHILVENPSELLKVVVDS